MYYLFKKNRKKISNLHCFGEDVICEIQKVRIKEQELRIEN